MSPRRTKRILGDIDFDVALTKGAKWLCQNHNIGTLRSISPNDFFIFVCRCPLCRSKGILEAKVFRLDKKIYREYKEGETLDPKFHVVLDCYGFISYHHPLPGGVGSKRWQLRDHLKQNVPGFEFPLSAAPVKDLDTQYCEIIGYDGSVSDLSRQKICSVRDKQPHRAKRQVGMTLLDSIPKSKCAKQKFMDLEITERFCEPDNHGREGSVEKFETSKKRKRTKMDQLCRDSEGKSIHMQNASVKRNSRQVTKIGRELLAPAKAPKRLRHATTRSSTCSKQVVEMKQSMKRGHAKSPDELGKSIEWLCQNHNRLRDVSPDMFFIFVCRCPLCSRKGILGTKVFVFDKRDCREFKKGSKFDPEFHVMLDREGFVSYHHPLPMASSFQRHRSRLRDHLRGNAPGFEFPLSGSSKKEAMGVIAMLDVEQDQDHFTPLCETYQAIPPLIGESIAIHDESKRRSRILKNMRLIRDELQLTEDPDFIEILNQSLKKEQEALASLVL